MAVKKKVKAARITQRFTLSKKLVVQVKYYEQMFTISDSDGVRIYTGSDEKKAREILAALRGYYGKRRCK